LAIFVTRPYIPSKRKLNEYFDDILSRRQLTNNGPLVRELTTRLESFIGVNNLLLVGSGTLALQVAIRLAKLKGNVLTTPFSFPATTSALVWTGCSPLFQDIDPDTYNIDVQKISESKLKDQNVSGILATHVFGAPCEVEELDRISKSMRIPLLYDSSHCFGVRFEGKSVLSYGDISVLSFHATKIFQTVEGGALIFKTREDYEIASEMINFGYDQKGVLSSVGINAKMNEFEAAMGLALLDEIEIIMAGYQTASEKYNELLSQALGRQKIAPGCDYNYSYFPVLFPSEDTLIRASNSLNKIDVYPRRYFSPSLDTVGAYRSKQRCEVSRDIASRILCLPLYAEIELKDVERISKAINVSLSSRPKRE